MRQCGSPRQCGPQPGGGRFPTSPEDVRGMPAAWRWLPRDIQRVRSVTDSCCVCYPRDDPIGSCPRLSGAIRAPIYLSSYLPWDEPAAAEPAVIDPAVIEPPAVSAKAPPLSTSPPHTWQGAPHPAAALVIITRLNGAWQQQRWTKMARLHAFESLHACSPATCFAMLSPQLTIPRCIEGDVGRSQIDSTISFV